MKLYRPLYYSYVYLQFQLSIIIIVSNFGFGGRILILIVSIPGHYLSFTLHCLKYSQNVVLDNLMNN